MATKNKALKTEKNPRKRNVTSTENSISKQPPKEDDYLVLLLRLQDGRILALGNKDQGDELKFRDVIMRNPSSLFSQYRLDPAEDLAKFLSDKHAFYISEVFN